MVVLRRKGRIPPQDNPAVISIFEVWSIKTEAISVLEMAALSKILSIVVIMKNHYYLSGRCSPFTEAEQAKFS